MTLPTLMRAIAMNGTGGANCLAVEHAALPHPAAGEVLIRVHAAGINRPDLAQRMGLYPAPPGADPRLGLEVAGEIAALGEGVDRFAIGDHVAALVNGGGYAEYCIAPATQTLTLPQGISMVQGAALPETYFTVWANVFGHGRLVAGESLLVHGGTSGIGTTAIALAREFGATVYATAGSPEKCAACVELGAHAAIDYRAQDFVARIDDLTSGAGVDVVLDMVAGPYVSRNINCLAPNGRLVVIAVQGGIRDPDFSILPVMLKRLVITGSTLRPRTLAEKAAIADALRTHVWPALQAGRCLPQIYRVFSFSEVVQAHTLLESGVHIGKIILTP